MTVEIAAIHAWQALDSRARPTVAARVTLSTGESARAIVPAGASTGGHEATELRDGGTEFGGAGVERAVANVNGPIAQGLLGMSVADQRAIDSELEAIDGTETLGRLGANAVLAVSIACLRAASIEHGSLYEHLLAENDPIELPLPMVNVFSGGAHAQGLIDIQDVLVVPIGASTFAEAIRWSWDVRAACARCIVDSGGSDALVADEGGLAARLTTNEEAIAIVHRGIELAGLRPGVDAAIAIDVAANQMWSTESRYRLNVEDLVLEATAWAERIATWVQRHPIVSIEDPFHEDAWSDWSSFTTQLGSKCQIIGDDLFATNFGRLERGAHVGAANAVLVKVNQAGTVTRAIDVLHEAHRSRYRTIVSARSGDTEDDWLADLAVGLRAGQIKVGSLMRSERTAKWNRLLEIESIGGARTTYLGAKGLDPLRFER